MSPSLFAVAERHDYYGSRTEWRYIASTDTEEQAATVLLDYSHPREYVHGEYGRRWVVLPVAQVRGASVYEELVSAPSDLDKAAHLHRAERVADDGDNDPHEDETIDEDVTAALAECGYVELVDEAGDYLLCRVAP